MFGIWFVIEPEPLYETIDVAVFVCDIIALVLGQCNCFDSSNCCLRMNMTESRQGERAYIQVK